jgi:tetratricopeptide (TPR) repeat protein
MPQGAYHSVIEGPAARLNGTNRELKIEAALTQQLLEDIEKGGNKDALPLLAFTMERLYLEYASSGDLTLKEYQEMGGIEGAIEAAVELALDSAEKDPSLPNDRASLIALLRRGLIPWLAGIDPQTQTPRRRVANLSEIPAEARPMIDHLIAQRLLETDVDQLTKEITIEPAHEALLRQWGLLHGWLEEDFAALTIIESIQRASRDWQANGENQDWLSHSAGRLQDAEEIKQRDDLSQFLKPADWTYLNQCRTLENDIRNKELNEARKLVEVQQREADAQKIVAKRTTMGMVVAVILMIISAFLGWQALQEQKKAVEQRTVAESERTRAEVEAEKAQAVSRFMQSTFEAANPFYGGRKDIQLIEALDQRVSHIEKSFAKQPVIQAAVKHTIGLNYQAMQEFEKAETLMSDALALRIEHLQPNDPDISLSYLDMSNLQREQGHYDEAKEAITKALSLTKERVGEQSMEIVPMLDELVQVQLMMGEFDLAKASADQALKLRRDLSESDADIAQGLHNRAQADSFTGDNILAEPYAKEALALRRKVGDIPVLIMNSLNLNAVIASSLGHYDDAQAYFQEAIDISTQVLGANHGETALLKENLGNIWYQQKRYNDTLKMLEEVLDIRQSTFGANSDMVGRTNANMGTIYMAIGQHERAQGHLDTALEIFEIVLPPNHPNLAQTLRTLAKNESAQGLHASAMARLERARNIQIEGFGLDAWQVGYIEKSIGRALILAGETAKAKVWLISAREKLSRHPDPDNPYSKRVDALVSNLEETENIENPRN